MIAKNENHFKKTFTSVSFLLPDGFFISTSRDNVSFFKSHTLKIFSLAVLTFT